MVCYVICLPCSAGEDYIEQRVNVNIPAGDTNYIVEIPFVDDIIVEGAEYFVVHLSTTDSSLVISTTTATVTIQEDDSKKI